jgi:hypothetical protein
MSWLETRKRGPLRLTLLLTTLCFTPALHPFTAEQGSEIADRLATAIEDNYVEPDVAREIAARLRKGTWTARDESAMANLFTQTLQPYDGHFSVRYRPPGEPQSEPPAVDYAGAAQRRNYGFKRIEILRGNIGYIDLREFASGEPAAGTAAATMQYLKSTDALIVDLRRNGGGDPAMVQVLCSYLLEPGVHLNSLYWRPSDQTNQFWTLPVLPGARTPDKPVFVLIGRRTASAAEEFAYNLRALERAQLVGQTTYGAANPGGSIDIGNGFSVFVSTGKAINPVTGDNWEKVGVEPHVSVSEVDALDVAHGLALDTAMARVEGQLARQEIEWAQAYLRARLTPVSHDQLEHLVGRYGDRTISLDGSRLWYQRDGRMAEPLVSASPTLHFLESSAQMRLRIEKSEPFELIEEFYDGFTRSFARVSDRAATR